MILLAVVERARAHARSTLDRPHNPSRLSPTTLNVGFSAMNQRTIPRYPRAIDFPASVCQNQCHLKGAWLCACSPKIALV
jgi:hypothetical protein